MKRMKLSIKILMVPILLGVLFGASGCYCMMPWEWWDHGGERGYNRGPGDGDYHHDDGDRHHDGGHD